MKKTICAFIKKIFHEDKAVAPEELAIIHDFMTYLYVKENAPNIGIDLFAISRLELPELILTSFNLLDEISLAEGTLEPSNVECVCRDLSMLYEATSLIVAKVIKEIFNDVKKLDNSNVDLLQNIRLIFYASINKILHERALITDDNLSHQHTFFQYVENALQLYDTKEMYKKKCEERFLKYLQQTPAKWTTQQNKQLQSVPYYNHFVRSGLSVADVYKISLKLPVKEPQEQFSDCQFLSITTCNIEALKFKIDALNSLQDNMPNINLGRLLNLKLRAEKLYFDMLGPREQEDFHYLICDAFGDKPICDVSDEKHRSKIRAHDYMLIEYTTVKIGRSFNELQYEGTDAAKENLANMHPSMY